MRILLVGEFSGLHSNFKYGLEKLGYSVDFLHFGDGYKKFPGAFSYPGWFKKNAILDAGYRRSLVANFLFREARGYDVVQLIGLGALFARFFPYSLIAGHLKRHNGIIATLAAGSDAFYWHKAKSCLDYGPFEDQMMFDFQGRKPFLASEHALNHNVSLMRHIDVVIPLAYEYALGYSDYGNVSYPITMPFAVEPSNSQLQENVVNEKSSIKVFHGISRFGFKGSSHILQAFSELESDNRYETMVVERLSYADYVEAIRNVDCVVDQVNSYSYGYNALLAMSFGKMVISGAEKVAMDYLNVDPPVLNCKPSSQSILDTIYKFARSDVAVQDLGTKGRDFVRKYHDPVTCSRALVDIWSSYL